MKHKSEYTLLHKFDVHNPEPISRPRAARLLRTARARHSALRIGNSFVLTDCNLLLFLRGGAEPVGEQLDAFEHSGAKRYNNQAERPE